jgi:hypothetical protein
VAKSVDGGASWTLVNTGLPVFVNAIAVDGPAPTTIYAAKSTDGGMT